MSLPPSFSLSIYSALRDSAVKTPEKGKKIVYGGPDGMNLTKRKETT